MFLIHVITITFVVYHIQSLLEKQQNLRFEETHQSSSESKVIILQEKQYPDVMRVKSQYCVYNYYLLPPERCTALPQTCQTELVHHLHTGICDFILVIL